MEARKSLLLLSKKSIQVCLKFSSWKSKVYFYVNLYLTVWNQNPDSAFKRNFIWVFGTPVRMQPVSPVSCISVSGPGTSCSASDPPPCSCTSEAVADDGSSILALVTHLAASWTEFGAPGFCMHLGEWYNRQKSSSFCLSNKTENKKYFQKGILQNMEEIWSKSICSTDYWKDLRVLTSFFFSYLIELIDTSSDSFALFSTAGLALLCFDIHAILHKEILYHIGTHSVEHTLGKLLKKSQLTLFILCYLANWQQKVAA